MAADQTHYWWTSPDGRKGKPWAYASIAKVLAVDAYFTAGSGRATVAIKIRPEMVDAVWAKMEAIGWRIEWAAV